MSPPRPVQPDDLPGAARLGQESVPRCGAQAADAVQGHDRHDAGLGRSRRGDRSHAQSERGSDRWPGLQVRCRRPPRQGVRTARRQGLQEEDWTAAASPTGCRSSRNSPGSTPSWRGFGRPCVSTAPSSPDSWHRRGPRSPEAFLGSCVRLSNAAGASCAPCGRSLGPHWPARGGGGRGGRCVRRRWPMAAGRSLPTGPQRRTLAPPSRVCSCGARARRSWSHTNAAGRDRPSLDAPATRSPRPRSAPRIGHRRSRNQDKRTRASSHGRVPES